MTDRRALLAALLALGCRGRQRPTAPDVPAAPPAPDVVVVENDVPAPQDVLIRDLSIEDAPRPAARSGPWRALPRVDLTGALPLGHWDDAPDRDGDELPDPMLAVHWNTVAARCAPSAERPCPAPSPEDLGPDARDGALTLAYVTVYSGDNAGRDAGSGPLGRVVGTRRVWRSSASPRAALRAVEFSEFGAGVIARASLEVVDGVGATDVLEVADVYTGEGAERHAGALLHHCRTATDGAATRGGSVGVSAPSLAPMMFRAAMAHPFSGCAADLAPWEQRVAALFSDGLTVTVTRDVPSPARGGHVAIARVDDEVTAVERGAPGYREPSSDGAVRVVAMERVCRGDRVRWRVGDTGCAGVIPRDDLPVQGCAAADSPLDPTRAQPVAVIAPEGTERATLLFTRGGPLLSASLPTRCRRWTALDAAVAHAGPAPALTAASPDGAQVLVAQGLDLWLARRGHATPLLVNGPASRLPRGTTRALAFLDARTVAAVISTHLVTFTMDVSDEAEGPPEGVFVDGSELRRGPR